LFIQALRICLIQNSRIIDSPFAGHLVIFLILLSLGYLAYRNSSQVLAIIVWVMAVITSVVSGSTHVMLALMAALTGSAILCAIRKGWWSALIVSIFFAYFIYLLWILGNPIMKSTVEVPANHQYGYVYMFAVALAYSFMALLPRREGTPKNKLNAPIVLNGLGFSVLFTLTVLNYFTENYALYFGLIAMFCLGYSIWLLLHSNWKPIAAMYAIYSFLALSITIAGIYQFPLAFFLLSIQSLLVVIMALWFRSRFIVIMNTFLFAGLLIAYVASAELLNSINFSFALVALITARILNWKKQRLEIRTELIRNFFLFTGAVMVLFSLHEAVPANFVTLSWALSAMLFFILSVLIRNMKYRWIGIVTMVITVFYLFIVDLSNISLGYRVIALMFLAAVSLGISIFYSRRVKSKKEVQK
jgi:hypothetical protein